MNLDLIRFGLPFLTSFVIIHLSVPYIIRFSIKTKWGVDTTGDRKIHQEPTPRIGGIGVFISFSLSTFALYFLGTDQFFYKHLSHFFGLFLGTTLIFGLGLIDDFIGLTVKKKIFVQTFIVLLMTAFFKAGIKHLHLPILGQVILPSHYAILLSIFWIVGITNTLNLIDGMDGLSSGTTMIAALALSTIAFITDQRWLALCLLLLCVSSASFLQYNWPPAKAFIGDGGAYLYGFTLSTLSILVCYNSNKPSLVYAPVVILGLPIVDTTYAIGRRLISKRPIFSADRKHIHHQLMDIGFSTVQVLLILYLVCFTFAGLGIYFVFTKPEVALAISFCTIISVVVLLYLLNWLTRLKNTKALQD